MKIKLFVTTLLGFMLMPILQGCKPAYATVSFEEVATPKAPDYSKNESWAVMPNQWPSDLKTVISAPSTIEGVDVFYVYPTLFVDRKDHAWNADIYDPNIRKEVFQSAVKYQASAWGKAGQLYVPFYRQTHYRVFVSPYDKQGGAAWEVSYSDIKSAFDYYLQHYNQGKGIIIAAHSQGTMHAKRLVKEFFDGTPLQKQLVAAYLVGAKIRPDEFGYILPLESPNAIGGFVSWNTYKKNKLPDNYASWYKGGVTTNPILWDHSNTADAENHKGVLNRDLKIYPQSLSIEKTDGMLWASLPKIPSRIFLSFVKSYHFADINLFWEDININAQIRAKAWLEKNNRSDAL